MLNAQVPLIHLRHLRVDIDGANSNLGSIHGIGIKRQIESVCQDHVVGGCAGAGRGDIVVHEPGQVLRQLIFAAIAIKELIEASIATADHGVRRELVNDARSRREVIPVRRDQPIPIWGIGSREGLACGRIKVRHAVRAIMRPGGVVVAQTKVQGKLGNDLPRILGELAEHPDALIDTVWIGQRDRRWVPQQEISQTDS